MRVATAPELAGVSGNDFADANEARPGERALDDDAERLWTISERALATSVARRSA